MPQDAYQTIKHPVEGLYKEKGSKFLAHAYPVQTGDEIKEHLAFLKKKYYDARHHCFAWQLGTDGMNFRMNDDGEPSGTAGKPILGQILSSQVTNVLVVVVRYFGGVKLGTGGLVQAYKAAAGDALGKAEMIECTIDKSFSIRFSYDLMNPVMKVINDEGITVTDREFEADCRLTLTVRASKFDQLVGRFQKTYGIEVLQPDEAH